MPYYNQRKPEDIQLTVSEPAELMKFLIAALPQKNRNNIKTMLRENQVVVNGVTITQFNHPLLPGNKVIIRALRTTDERSYRGITILHEDNELIVIDKHAGILAVPVKKNQQLSALNILARHVKQQHRQNTVHAIQRLDRESSGIMLFARSERTQKLFQRKWNELVVERVYLAVVEGQVESDEGRISSYIRDDGGLRVSSSQDKLKGSYAETSYKVIRRSSLFSMLELRITAGGIKDQLRVHMVEAGHPIIGDRKYGATANPSDRLGLHAWKLALHHPASGDLIRIESPVPRKLGRLF